MPGPDRRRTLAACLRVAAIISLTIAALTAVTATFLYVVFGRPTSETPMPPIRHRDPIDGRPAANARPASRDGEPLIPENRSTVEYLPPISRSMNGRPRASTGIRLPLTDGGSVHDVSASRNRYPNNHRYGSGDGGVSSAENYDVAGDTLEAETQRNINRQINYIDYSNFDTVNWTTEKDGSTGYRDSSDLTYNMDNYGNKQIDDLTNINELHRDPGVELDPYYSTIYGPYHNRPSGSQPIMDHQQLSTDYRLPSKSYQPPSTNYQLPNTHYQQTDMVYQPPRTNDNPPSTNYEPPKSAAPQNPIPQDPREKIAIPTPNTSSAVDWRLIGILSLVKLGIVNLKSITIIKILLFLLINLKLLLITVFFKFLLLLKFVKAIMLPFLFVSLLLTSLILPTILSSLFSIPGRIIRLLFTQNNAANQATMTPSNMMNMMNMMANQPGNTMVTIPNQPGNTMVTIPNQQGSVARPPGTTIVLPNLPANAPGTGGGTAGGTNAMALARLLDQFLLNNNGMPSTKSETAPFGWHPESLDASFPIMDVFWKIIDSEKCVERIACRMAVTEESSTMPIWINWVMRGVSKFIPNKKLELYFKTYDDINNEVLTSPPTRTPDDWNTWCLEHYNCKSTNVTHVSDA